MPLQGTALMEEENKVLLMRAGTGISFMTTYQEKAIDLPRQPTYTIQAICIV
jgi:hypothetical protein